MHLATQKICILVVGKEANTFSTLRGIGNCVKKTGQEKLYLPTERPAPCSVGHTYFRSSLRILFAGFLETKTQI